MAPNYSTKQYLWILPLLDRLQGTSRRAVEVVERLLEVAEAEVEARVAAEVAREHVRRARRETSNELEGGCIGKAFPCLKGAIKRFTTFAPLHIHLIDRYDLRTSRRAGVALSGMSAY